VSAAYSQDPVLRHLFADADEQYESMKATLESEAFRELPEAEVERWLTERQRELMRRLLQSHLTLRGQEQAVGPVVGADEAERTHTRPGKARNLETAFGTVEVERTAHAGRNLSALFPVDARLNLPEHKYSHEVERLVAKATARMSFDASLDTLGELTGAHVPKRQAEEIVQRAAKDFNDFYHGRGWEGGAPTSKLLVLSFDQKGVVLRKEDLTEATRQAAECSQTKMETRGSKGEPKRGRKRMSTVAAVYTVAPHVRTPQEIIAGLRHVRDTTAKPRPRPEFKRVWASLERAPQEIIADAFTEALWRDPEQQKTWVVLIDGDRKLERWVRAEAKRRGVHALVVLDFIHALEYLWKAGRVFHKEGTRELEEWVLERLERMLQGKISGVVAGMRRMATYHGVKKKERKPLDKAARYLLKRKAMMRYDKLLVMGTPIASGIIEGACRHLINDRLDVTGARWRLPSAEAVLRLRSLISSGDFERYWQYHEGKERTRNHESCYAEGALPKLCLPKGRCRLNLVK
jgi:hypothetical protein